MRVERIGECTLYLGDCLDVLSTLGATVDIDNAVEYTEKHGKSAIREPEAEPRGGGDLGKSATRNRAALCERRLVASERTGELGSYVHDLPQQDAQGALVAIPEGWAILTDPPYGIGMDGGKVGRSEYEKKDWDTKAADVSWIADNGVPAIIWGGNYFALPPSQKWLVWDKRNDPTTFADCELAWTNIGGSVRIFRWLWSGPYQQKREDRFHPTQKPLALLEWCLGFLPDALSILDPFMGSGTTLVACAKLGRRGIGIEIDEGYFDMACRRVEEAYRQPDMFIERPPSPVQETLW